MDSYCSFEPEEILKVTHDCNTTYCAAGYLAHEDNYPDQYVGRDTQNPEIGDCFRYQQYSENLIGFDRESLEWTFLFHHDWPDNLASLKMRAKYVLENGKCPEASPHVNTHYLSFKGFVDIIHYSGEL